MFAIDTIIIDSKFMDNVSHLDEQKFEENKNEDSKHLKGILPPNRKHKKV